MTTVHCKLTQIPSSSAKKVRISHAFAWAIADKLGTTIDAVVGRATAHEEDGHELDAFYESLSEGGRQRLDEYAQFLAFRERVLATEGR